jgi:hypothetical protein
MASDRRMDGVHDGPDGASARERIPVAVFHRPAAASAAVAAEIAARYDASSLPEYTAIEAFRIWDTSLDI